MTAIYVYDLDLNRIGSISTMVSCVWTEGYNTEGLFQLECVYTEDVYSLLQLDYYCGKTGADTLMVIKSIQVEDNTIVVNGYPATHVFSDRVSTEVISNETAETAMRTLFSAMDAYPCFELDDEAGLTEVFSSETSDGTLQEYFETIAQGCDLGFRMRYDASSKALKFCVYQGEENANAKYSTYYGNMNDITYSLSSTNYKNVAVVAGAGTGDDRVTVYAGDTDSTGADRREMYVDARQEQPEDDETDEEYEARLVAYGETELIEQVKVESISFTLDDEKAELGDIVFAYIPELGLSVKVRVIEITETMQNNLTARTATLGTPVVLRRY